MQSLNKEGIERLGVPLPPLDIQRDLVEKVAAQRKAIAELKAKAEEKSQQAKADVEAMILGTRKLNAP